MPQNMNPYKLLYHVYSGSVTRGSLEGLPEGSGHIVTFSWGRALQVVKQMKIRVVHRNHTG